MQTQDNILGSFQKDVMSSVKTTVLKLKFLDFIDSVKLYIIVGR